MGRERERGLAEDKKIQKGGDWTALKVALGMPRGSGQKLQPSQMITGDSRRAALVLTTIDPSLSQAASGCASHWE